MVGITDRMVQKIVSELVEYGYLEVNKVGRRNTYQILLAKTYATPWNPIEESVTSRTSQKRFNNLTYQLSSPLAPLDPLRGKGPGVRGNRA